MDCPHCGLINPPTAERCDCGYTFTTRSGGTERPYTPEEKQARALKSALLIFALIVFFLMLWKSPLSYLQEPAKIPATPQASKAAPKSEVQLRGESERLQICRDKLKKLQSLDVLQDLAWKPPSEPRVVVGPTFFTIPFDAKEVFAETVNCLLMAGATDRMLNFDLLDWQTNKAVGRFSYGKLTIQ